MRRRWRERQAIQNLNRNEKHRPGLQTSILIFSSSLLLFTVQPMLGKALLPVWGGSASVWTACLLFFQCGLLLGYLYAFGSVRWLSPKQQGAVHVALVIVSMLWMPLSIRIASLTEGLPPALGILWTLLAVIGVPLVVLSSTSPLLSHWHAEEEPDRDPYWLYAVSNLGSLLGCLVYPFAIEPILGLRTQQWLWTGAYVILGVGWIAYAIRSVNFRPYIALPRDTAKRVHAWQVFAWLALSGCSAIVLAAATNNLSQAGIVVPGLWVMPLAIYLATWWIAFRWPVFGCWGWQMGLFYFGSLIAVVLLIWRLWFPWLTIVVGYGLVVLLIGLACHALLYSLRPSPVHLTKFYLAMALGGALGSAFVLLIAPIVFTDYWELHFGLALGAATGAAYHTAVLWPRMNDSPIVRRVQWPITMMAAILLICTLWMQASIRNIEETVARRRDFYGVVSVIEQPKLGNRAMLLGQTIHGSEPMEGELHPDKTLYYRTNSGIALAWGWAHNRFDRPLQVGIIGLGTGSLSLYAGNLDHVIYYEISPAVRVLAEEHFRYLGSHRGDTEIRMGDGRTRIAREAADSDQQPLDLLIVDAFTNDSLPMHLLTVQAIEQYRARLQPDGLIAMHITNRNLDLAPVMFNAAQEVGLVPLLIESPMHEADAVLGPGQEHKQVRWLLMVPAGLPIPAWPGARTQLKSTAAAWTDDFGSPFHALRR